MRVQPKYPAYPARSDAVGNLSAVRIPAAQILVWRNRLRRPARPAPQRRARSSQFGNRAELDGGFSEEAENAAGFRAGRPAANGIGQSGGGPISLAELKPAALARDLPGLVNAGYRIERLTMIDLFPQTFQIETVAELSRQ